MRCFWFLLLFVTVFCVGVGVGYVGFGRGKEVVRADTVYRSDTVRCPIVRDSVVTRYITRRLAVMRVDTVRQSDTVRAVDTVEVRLPIVQKVYRDTNYTAWVSGYEPRLDSISVRHREVTLTKVTRVGSRWGVGVQVGYGIDKTLKPTPYVGVGLMYRLGR